MFQKREHSDCVFFLKDPGSRGCHVKSETNLQNKVASWFSGDGGKKKKHAWAEVLVGLNLCLR